MTMRGRAGVGEPELSTLMFDVLIGSDGLGDGAGGDWN
jgi:hypothetical protein